MSRIVAIERWRRMSPAAKKYWIEYAVMERLDAFEAGAHEPDDFERIQLSGALSGASSGFYDFARLCIVLIQAPRGEAKLPVFPAPEGPTLTRLADFRTALARVSGFPALNDSLF